MNRAKHPPTIGVVCESSQRSRLPSQGSTRQEATSLPNHLHRQSRESRSREIFQKIGPRCRPGSAERRPPHNSNDLYEESRSDHESRLTSTSFQKELNRSKKNEKLSHQFPKEKNRHIDKTKQTDILGPTPRKPIEVEFPHGCSIHLENKKLFAPLLIAIRDVLDDVATWARRHEEGTRVLLVLLPQNELSELTKAKEKTFLPIHNHEGDKIPKKVWEDLSKRLPKLRQNLKYWLRDREDKTTRVKERKIGSAVAFSHGFESLMRTGQIKNNFNHGFKVCDRFLAYTTCMV
ncbi:hypothetical protein F2Q69_00036375 [Brassica cretica]|uniref:Uncharacterized protein n=1 Tax=Brassica cretica TaxID=69181 RepID=A0A8S9SRN8_BRACR|nr:hypothetical protein F2Q69_00036375 [Brassica cretica]